MATTPKPLAAPLPFKTAALAGTEIPFTLATEFALLAEDLCRMHAGGDPSDDDELDPREADLLVRQAADALNAKIAATNAERVRTAFLEQLKLDKEGYFEDMKAYYEQGGTSEPFIVAFPNTPVKFDNDRQQWFVNLPAEFVNLPRYKNLPREQQAMVEPMRYADRALRSYIPMPGSSARHFMGQHPAGFQGNVGTQREGALLWFYTALGQKVPDEKVLLKVVIRTRDEVMAPEPGYLAAASSVEILGLAWELLMKRSKQDKHNDANDQR